MNREITKNSSDSIETIEIRPRRGWLELDLGDLWRYRDLLFFLAWRDVQVRYKQTALGITWAILQPLATMAIFSLVFGLLADLPSDGAPYPLFTYAALVPWQLFNYALTQSSNSLVLDQNLITKVYFPRIIIPIASVLAGVVDFIISSTVLVVMLAGFGIPLSTRLLFIPFLALFALASAVAAGLWLSALNVEYRDVRYALPFLSQVWFYATPIAYSSNLIPEMWRPIIGLNPMAGVVEGFRWVLLGTEKIPYEILAVSAVVVSILLISGMIFFRHMEDNFADII